MQKSPYFLLPLAALLSACGGGGQSTTNPDKEPPKQYVAVALTAGDFASYKEVVSYTVGGVADGPTTSYNTTVVTSVAADGSSTQSTTATSDNRRDEKLDSQRRMVSAAIGSACNELYSPGMAVAPTTLSQGISWDNKHHYTFNCDGDNSVGDVAIKGGVGALERVTVAAGTFDAFKIVSTLTATTARGKSDSSQTCWWEPNLGVAIKCTQTSVGSYTSPGQTVPSASNMTMSRELVGFATHKASRQQLNVERFAGAWSGSFGGEAVGQCKVTITPAGVLSGSCTGGMSMMVSGNVTPEGKLSFQVANGGLVGPTFSGTLDAGLQMGGTWTYPNGGGGTWSLRHD